MKLWLPGCALLAALCNSLVLAQQDAPLPSLGASPAALSPSASPIASPTPTVSILPPDLLPTQQESPALPVVPEILQLDAAFNQPPADPASELQRKHIEWRRLRNQVRNDPALKQALRTAEAAPTDLQKRKLLEAYYDLAYKKMTALAAADMKDYLADRKIEAIRALPQPRVRPDTGVQPAGAPVITVAATPSPTPTPKGAARLRPE